MATQEKVAEQVADQDEEKRLAVIRKQMKALEAKGISLTDMLDMLGLEAVTKGTVKADGRKARAEAWKAPRPLEGPDREVIESLPDIVTSGVYLEEPRALTPEEEDQVIRKAVAVRNAQDVLKGQYDGIRSTVFAHLDAVVGEGKGGQIVSPMFGWKAERSVRVKRDFDALEAVVSPEVWEAITVEVVKREVDEAALTEAMVDGRVSLEDLQSVSSLTPVFYVKQVKQGEKV